MLHTTMVRLVVSSIARRSERLRVTDSGSSALPGRGDEAVAVNAEPSTLRREAPSCRSIRPLDGRGGRDGVCPRARVEVMSFARWVHSPSVLDSLTTHPSRSRRLMRGFKKANLT